MTEHTGIPRRYWAEISLALEYLRRAWEMDTAGQPPQPTAEELRDKANAIFERLENDKR